MAYFTLSVIPGESDVLCESLDEALMHLREMLASDIEDPDGLMVSEYALHFDRAGAKEVLKRISSA
jgi:hypothetical protein